jgi:GNAT superfamily N-acetyltransferase
VQSFECGDAEYAAHVSLWIKERIWAKAFGSRGETIIVLDDDRDGSFVGYGTWKHVEDTSSVLRPLQIEIAWFGVCSDYQGVLYEEAPNLEAAPGDRPETRYTVADVVYAEVERFAREHDDSTPDMTITLTCHIDNNKAMKFYRKTGFRPIGEPNPQVEKDIYYRLVR